MPELPEVESVARALRLNLQDRVCTALRVRFAGVLAPSATAGPPAGPRARTRARSNPCPTPPTSPASCCTCA